MQFNFSWFQREDGDSPLKTGRATIRHGSLVIPSVKSIDSGTYFCTATNSEGSETLEVKVSVISSLSAHIQPSRQTVDLGKSADLVSNLQSNPWSLKTT